MVPWKRKGIRILPLKRLTLRQSPSPTPTFFLFLFLKFLLSINVLFLSLSLLYCVGPNRPKDPPHQNYPCPCLCRLTSCELRNGRDDDSDDADARRAARQGEGMAMLERGCQSHYLPRRLSHGSFVTVCCSSSSRMQSQRMGSNFTRLKGNKKQWVAPGFVSYVLFTVNQDYWNQLGVHSPGRNVFSGWEVHRLS